jgi:hypothetical protein
MSSAATAEESLDAALIEDFDGGLFEAPAIEADSFLGCIGDNNEGLPADLSAFEPGPAMATLPPAFELLAADLPRLDAVVASFETPFAALELLEFAPAFEPADERVLGDSLTAEAAVIACFGAMIDELQFEIDSRKRNQTLNRRLETERGTKLKIAELRSINNFQRITKVPEPKEKFSDGSRLSGSRLSYI